MTATLARPLGINVTSTEQERCRLEPRPQAWARVAVVHVIPCCLYCWGGLAKEA
jgi:hypothetical protein